MHLQKLRLEHSCRRVLGQLDVVGTRHHLQEDNASPQHTKRYGRARGACRAMAELAYGWEEEVGIVSVAVRATPDYC